MNDPGSATAGPWTARAPAAAAAAAAEGGPTASRAPVKYAARAPTIAGSIRHGLIPTGTSITAAEVAARRRREIWTGSHIRATGAAKAAAAVAAGIQDTGRKEGMPVRVLTRRLAVARGSSVETSSEAESAAASHPGQG